MKKICLLFVCCITLSQYSFANYDSLVLGKIEYDTTTCKLTVERNIGGHHTDVYTYVVRGPVSVNIPNQTANVAGGGTITDLKTNTPTVYSVPACDLTCSAGSSHVGDVITATVTGKDGGAEYVSATAAVDRTITVKSTTSVPVCLQCPEGKYWCSGQSACILKGATCSNHECNADTVCDIDEGCGCPACSAKQDHCLAGLICSYNSLIPNNSSCEKPKCGVGTYWCPGEAKCVTKGTDCPSRQCNTNGTCELNESCDCVDCSGQQDSCDTNLVCSYNATEKKNSECIATACDSCNTYWCATTKTCVANTVACNGTCSTGRTLKNGACVPTGDCLAGDNCCPINTTFCPLKSKCLPVGQACESAT